MGPPGSLAPLLSALRPLFPPALLSGLGLDAVLAGAASLPASAAAHMGFEFRLGTDEPLADLCVAVDATGPLCGDLVVRRSSAPAGPPAAVLGALAAGLRTRAAPWARRARFVIAEYDCAPPARSDLAGVFLTFGPSADPPDTVELLTAGFPAAVGSAPLPELRPAVERLLAAIGGAGAAVTNAGLFVGRPAVALRVVVAGFRPAAVAPALRRLGWPGDRAAVGAFLRDVGPAATGVGLSVDLAAGTIGPRIGVELFAGPQGGAWAAGRPADWRSLVDRLVGLDLCVAAKAAGLLAWFGRDRLFMADGLGVACRGVNHVKVSFGDGPPAAKAYVGLAVLPVGGRVAAAPVLPRPGTP